MAKNDIIPVRIVNDSNRTNNLVPSKFTAVVASDTTVLSPGELYVGTGGDLVVMGANDSATVTFMNVPDGTFLPILVKMVYTTGTGCSDMLILR